MNETKTCYTDEELEEFRQIILKKLAVARRDYQVMMDEIAKRNDNGVDDTMPTYHALEECSTLQSKENQVNMAVRAQKYIQGLEAALLRIEHRTYGICRETGRLIPKERLRAVPHATLSIEAKNERDKRK